ncbi:hypothetical protein P5673_025075 [Acropora cervicornis]|uniref:Uncharacterized protein n=1 Tax=Acropora cervicornis TaxID=6130 RepID=A0AAD9Q2K7_ACRCE|nr:hypothetical protein P5673_025075 [Acropora cervicornis]
MLATSMRGIHERYDSTEKAIQTLVEQQKTNEKKLEELMAFKTSRPLNLVVSHLPLNTCSGSTLVTTQPLESTQRGRRTLRVLSSPASAEKVDTAKQRSTVIFKLTVTLNYKSMYSTTCPSFRLHWTQSLHAGITASLSVIKREEEQARGVPKSLAFNLLNILVNAKTQAESNISGQNGKKSTGQEHAGCYSIKCSLTDTIKHLCFSAQLDSHFEWSKEESAINWKREEGTSLFSKTKGQYLHLPLPLHALLQVRPLPEVVAKTIPETVHKASIHMTDLCIEQTALLAGRDIKKGKFLQLVMPSSPSLQSSDTILQQIVLS